VPTPALIAVLSLYALASAVTFVAYGLDKAAAARATGGRGRIRERTLHLFELFGGWPGALLAQRCFRHKTIDPTFRLVFWAIVLLHAAAWGVFLWWRLSGS
jgi:uncharacterized membrane protein YsdA (DUF1294 family)